jgi:hypothetical protein
MQGFKDIVDKSGMQVFESLTPSAKAIGSVAKKIPKDEMLVVYIVNPLKSLTYPILESLQPIIDACKPSALYPVFHV